MRRMKTRSARAKPAGTSVRTKLAAAQTKPDATDAPVVHEHELFSPTDLGAMTDGEPGEHHKSLGFAHFFWSPEEDFPAYLKKCRERSGLTLREAAKAVGFSFAVLGRLELGEYPKRPNLSLLSRLADLYEVDQRELLHIAGVRVKLPEGINLEAQIAEQFRSVFLDPALRPPLIDERAIEFFSHRMKRAILELIGRLVEQPDPKKYFNAAKASKDKL